LVKSVRVAVFAKGRKATEAEKAGADIVGSEELAAKVEKGDIEFDICIATPDMMALVGKLGKVLGPKGLMPNPKLGSVTMNVADAVKPQIRQVEFRTDKPESCMPESARRASRRMRWQIISRRW